MKPDLQLFMKRYWEEPYPAKRAIIRRHYFWLVEIMDALYKS